MTTTRPLRLGTRASALATTQSGHVADLVRERLGREVELVEVSTEGDVNRAPLASMGGTGVFVSALRDDQPRAETIRRQVESLLTSERQHDPSLLAIAVPDPDESLRNELGLVRTEGGGAPLKERLLLPSFNVLAVRSMYRMVGNEGQS